MTHAVDTASGQLTGRWLAIAARLRWLGLAIDWATQFCMWLTPFMAIVIALCIIYEVVSRTVFGQGTGWVDESAIFATMGIAFFGAGYVLKRDKHVRTDLITSRLSERTATVLHFSGGVILSLWLSVFGYSFANMVAQSRSLGFVRASVLETPVYVPQAVLLVGVLILVLQGFKTTIREIPEVCSLSRISDRPRYAVLAPIDRWFIILPLYAVLLAAALLMVYAGGSPRLWGLFMLMIVLLLTGMPIFGALGVFSSLGFLATGGGLMAQQTMAPVAFEALDKFSWSCLPLYLVAGAFFSASGFARRLFDFAVVVAGRLPGCLAIASVSACAMFSAISGSSIATATTIGTVAVPEMVRRNYEKDLAIGSISVAGTLAILIPPSMGFISYGVLTGTSIGKLFIAGIVPGVMLAVMYATYIYFRTRANPRYKYDPSTQPKSRTGAVVGAGPVIVGFAIVIGGIYTGVFTATEAAAVLMLYCFVLVLLANRNVGLSKLLAIVRDSSVSVAMLFMIISSSMVMGKLLSMEQIPQAMVKAFLNTGLPPFGVLALVLLLFLVGGMFLETAALMFIVLPIIFPVIKTLGFDPVWFGVLFIVTMEIGQVSPPVGIVAFTIQGVLGESTDTVFKGIIPFMWVAVAGLVLFTLFPTISTWLPSMMMGK